MNFSTREKFLVLLAQSGDKIAFDELLQISQEPLFRYIYRLTNNRELAEDILQEVFFIIYRKLKWLENPKLFRAWTYRIASREAFRQLKNEKNWSEQIRDDDFLETIQAETFKENYEPELIKKIPEMLGKVSPASRAVLVLHYLDEMSLSEVAEVLEINLGTAKSRLNYGLEMLRKNYGRSAN
ncbi:MAG: RNA polymerase sigma factor [Pyrinomonadaceae bacterium]|jgi:RNA polymerase sigma-70 factor (ECF subfamily)|nr:RNA polymerase sigma factor [Pyrinomonadaceae bacterium]